MTEAISVILAIIVALLAGLAMFTQWFAGAIERRHPPQGHFVSTGEARLHVLDIPASRPGALTILFLHGASGNLEDLSKSLRPGLEGRHRLIFIDRPGHGYSTRGPNPMDRPADQASRIAQFLDQSDIGPVVVVGFSWGASVAAAMGVLYPQKVAALVFLAPATHPWPGGVKWYYRLGARPILGRLFSHTLALPVGLSFIDDAILAVFKPKTPPQDYRSRAAADLALRPQQFIANCRDIAGLKEAVAELSPRYSGISVPVEIVTGDRDGVVLPTIHAEGLERDITGARLTVLDGVGHMPHWDATLETVAAIERAVRRAQSSAPAAAE